VSGLSAYSARIAGGPLFFGSKLSERPAVTIKAMAAKLARLVYRMLRYGMQFVDKGAEYYQARRREP